jgi:hypothetical protein
LVAGGVVADFLAVMPSLAATGVAAFLVGASVDLAVGAGLMAVEGVVVLTGFVAMLFSDFLDEVGVDSARLRVSITVDFAFGFAG